MPWRRPALPSAATIITEGPLEGTHIDADSERCPAAQYGTYASGRALENVQHRGLPRPGHPPIARASLSAGYGHVDRRR